MRQDQSVDGGTAVQAGGDVIIYQAMSAQQMGEIIAALGNQLAVYAAESQKVLDERLDEFKQSVLTRFAQPGEANPEAF
jgi:hypothetical protein